MSENKTKNDKTKDTKVGRIVYIKALDTYRAYDASGRNLTTNGSLEYLKKLHPDFKVCVEKKNLRK